MARLSARERLVDAAIDVFYREGFTASGIEKVLNAADVSRMSLYRHFQSKDELILAAIDTRDRRFRSWLRERIEGATEDPRGRLLALFDVLDQWIKGDAFPAQGFSGCFFVNAAAEFHAPGDPVHRAAAAHKRALGAYGEELARAAGVAEPRLVAKRLALLKEGAVSTAHVSGDIEAARDAREIAEKVLADAPVRQ